MKTKPYEGDHKVPVSTKPYRDMQRLNEISLLNTTIGILEQQLHTAHELLQRLEDDY